MTGKVSDAARRDLTVLAVTPLIFIVVLILGTVVLSHGTANPKSVSASEINLSKVTLLGVVTDGDSGAKLAGASVNLGANTVKADKDGNFLLDDLSVGKIRLTITLSGYQEFHLETFVRRGINKAECKLVSVFRVPKDKPKYEPIPPEVVKSGNPNQPRVAFTFDDGWYPDYRILDLMQQSGLRGTAFLIGGRGVANEHPELVQKLEEAGFEVATHGYSHQTITNLNEAQLNEEIRKGQAEITEVSGKQYPYFRCSGGSYDERTLNIVAANGYKLVLWSLDSFDSRKGYTNKERADNLLANLHNGAIIVFHLGGSETYDLLNILIPEIQSRGYEIGTVTDVLEP